MFNTILGTLAVVGLIYLMIKVPKSRYYVAGACWIIACGFAIFCGYHLNIYYNEIGGIFGAITGIFETNVVVVDDLNFSMQNLELVKKSESDDTYIAKSGQNKVLSQLTAGESYTIYVNGVPVTDAEYASDYAFAKYEYTFFDESMTEICSDTLEIRFAFDKNFTTLTLTTNGGEQSAKLWNSYFNRNSFEISIKISDFISSDPEVVPGEIDENQFARITYYYNDEVYKKQVYKKGQTIVYPENPTIATSDWCMLVDGSYVKFSDKVASESVDLYYVESDNYLVKYYSGFNGEIFYQEVVTSGSTSQLKRSPSRNDAEFLGWSIDGVNVIDNTVYEINDNVNFIAVWEVNEIYVKVLDAYGNTCQSCEVDVYSTLTLTAPLTITDDLGQTATLTGYSIMSGDGSIISSNQVKVGIENCVIQSNYDILTVVSVVAKNVASLSTQKLYVGYKVTDGYDISFQPKYKVEFSEFTATTSGSTVTPVSEDCASDISVQNFVVTDKSSVDIKVFVKTDTVDSKIYLMAATELFTGSKELTNVIDYGMYSMIYKTGDNGEILYCFNFEIDTTQPTASIILTPSGGTT